MDERVRRALARGHLIDITTTGRRSHQARRIEITFHVIDGRIYISGMPRADRKRGWLWNLEADPAITVHLKGAVQADLAGTARIITDDAERRAVADWIKANAWKDIDATAMVAHAPMIEVVLLDQAA